MSGKSRISAFLGLCGVLAAGLLLVGARHAGAAHVPRRDAARPGGEEWASRYGAAGPCLLEGDACVRGCVIPVAEPGVPAQPCSPTGATRPCIIQVSGTVTPAPPGSRLGCGPQATGRIEYNRAAPRAPARR